MDAQKIAVDAVVALTDCDRDAVTAFIRKLYLAGVKEPQAPDLQGPAGNGAGLTPRKALFLIRNYAAAAIDFKKPSISACRLVVESDNCLADDSNWLDATPVWLAP